VKTHERIVNDRSYWEWKNNHYCGVQNELGKLFIRLTQSFVEDGMLEL
jgi:hypothetical protein